MSLVTRCITFTILLVGAATNANGQVLHHWRFSSENGLLEDSIGNADLRVVGGSSPTAFELEDDGIGASFPTSFDGIGENSHAAMFSSEIGGLQSDDVTILDSDFTVEVLTNLSNFRAPTAGVHLVTQAPPGLFVGAFSWSFHIRSGGTGAPSRGAADELVLIPSNGSNYEFIRSGIFINEDTDYYLSGALDLNEQVATFHAYNFADNSLQISTGPYRQGGLNPSSTVLIGDIPGFNGGTAHQATGLIDEVRISKGDVDFSASLLGEAIFDGEDGVQIDSLDLRPRTVDVLADNRITDQRTRSRTSVRSTAPLFMKFELPSFLEVDKLEAATLRLGVSAVASDDNAPLSLFHSSGDNDFDASASELASETYVDTSLDVLQSGGVVGELVEVELDVTDLIRSDFREDGTSAFQFRTDGDSRFFLSMPLATDSQPQLLLSFASESTNNLAIGDIDGDGVVGFADFLILSANFGMAGTADGGDINGDGEIGFPDFLILSQNFGNSVDAVSVPEPSTESLGICVLLLSLLRRSVRPRGKWRC